MTAAAAGAAAAAAAGAAALRAQEAENDEAISADVWGRNRHAADDEAAALGDDPVREEQPVAEERGLTYRDVLMIVAQELRFAPPEALDRPVRVDLGDSIDGIQSIIFDPDAGRLVVQPWLTRGVPRVSLPAPGLHDFLIRQAPDAGAALKVIRARRETGRSAMSATTGVSPSTISNIERGVDNPSPEMLIKLAHALRTGLEIRDDADDRPDRPDFSISHLSQIGPALRALRYRRGVGVGVIASSTRLTQRMLRQYEDGSTWPSIPTLIRILDALDAVLALADLDRRAAI